MVLTFSYSLDFSMATNLLNSPDRSLLKLVNDEDDENTYNLTQSVYYIDVEMIELSHNKPTFSVISLNCQSIASKFEEFQYFMNYLLTHNCHIDVINLQETWQSNDTYYNKSLIIGNIYRPPRESNELITKFNDEFSKAIHHKIMKGKTLIMSGDFNINLLKINEKISYANFST